MLRLCQVFPGFRVHGSSMDLFLQLIKVELILFVCCASATSNPLGLMKAVPIFLSLLLALMLYSRQYGTSFDWHEANSLISIPLFLAE